MTWSCPDPIEDKGKVLNQITLFWMEMMGDLVPNHILATNVDDYPEDLHKYKAELQDRSVLVKKAKPLPIECIVRGFITGSGWADYQKTGKVCGHELPANLRESDMLEKPLFTPSTKADLGLHDENITLDQAAALIGEDMMRKVETLALSIYTRARDYAKQRGILIADTKFEFGHHRRRADPHRRGAHPGLLALLARGRVQARPVPAQLRQAVLPRLAGGDRLQQAAAPRPASRRTSRPGRATSTWKPTGC